MSKFQRPPLTEKEKEKAAQRFINGAARTSPTTNKKGEPRGVIFLRVPQTLIDDLKRIEQLTGYTPNMFCFQAIAEAITDKMKMLERETG